MKLALKILGIAALTLLAACGTRSSTGSPSLAPRGAQVRRVAFDNSYGPTTTLQVHVTADGGVEQTYPAACDARTCTFLVLLTNGSHTLTLAVEQDGRRSEPTTFIVDPGAEAKR